MILRSIDLGTPAVVAMFDGATLAASGVELRWCHGDAIVFAVQLTPADLLQIAETMRAWQDKAEAMLADLSKGRV